MMNSALTRPAAQGLSLVEMLLAVILVGIMSIIMSPSFSMLASSSKLSYGAQQTVVNQEMARGLEEYARNRSDSINGQTQAGRLPPPVTLSATSLTQAVPYQIADWTQSKTNSQTAQLLADMLEQGVPQDQLWSDGTAAHRARMYVLAPPLTQDVPLYFQSGPQVTITYDFAALYMTTCSANTGGTCDAKGGSLATGGASYGSNNQLTAANYTQWTTQTPDYPATFVTTLPVQMDMLRTTAQRLDRVRDAMVNYFKTKQLGAAANDNTNWYPLPTTGYTASNPLLNPLTNQGCVDKWIDLSLSTTDVLPQIGLTQAEYGQTAWGGHVEYCPQFDGTATGQMYNGPGPFVYYGALRINKSVTGGPNPNPANVSYTTATDPVNGYNVILTF